MVSEKKSGYMSYCDIAIYLTDDCIEIGNAVYTLSFLNLVYRLCKFGIVGRLFGRKLMILNYGAEKERGYKTMVKDAKRTAINKVKHYRALYHFGTDISDKVVYSNIVKGYLFALLDLGVITNSEYNTIMDIFYYKEGKVDLYENHE